MSDFLKPYKRLQKTLNIKISKSTICAFNYCKNSIEDNFNNIESLFIGSSHAFYGIDENMLGKNMNNISFQSQDLYYSYKLIEKYAETLNNLKNVIIFYSVFSSGFVLQKTREKDLCAYYKKIFDIEYKENDNINRLTNIEAIYNKLPSKIKKIASTKKLYLDCYLNSEYIKDIDTLDARISKHLRENKRGCSENIYIEMLNRLCKKHNVNLYVVFSPATNEYKNKLPNSNELFENINKIILDNEIAYIDLYNCNDFEDSDFFDYDHLNIKGAKKCTQKIINFIKK